MKTRVSIRTPKLSDAAAFLAAARQSRSLHRGWVITPAKRQAFRAYLKRIASDSHCGFLVIHRASGQIVGVININNIIRGAFCSAFLGYYTFSGLAG